MGGGPTEKLKNEVLLCVFEAPEPKESTARIREKFPELEVRYLQTKGKEEVPKATFHDVNILSTFAHLPPTPADCPHLKLVHFFSAGINHIVKHPIYTDTDITLTTSTGIHGPQIAEWIIMTALVQSHSYNRLYEAQKEKRWDKHRNETKVKDMVGQRVGILGYGSIGRQVGRVAKAMGMDVIAFTASPRKTPESRKDSGFIVPGTGDPDGSIPSAWYSGLNKESLHHFLKQGIDVLVISVPLTKETTRLLSKEEFSILSHRRPLISNISRGQIIDQPALTAALHAGWLRGAALDVTDPEPLPPDDPLWDAPNATITPHVSGGSEKYVERAFLVLEENLKRRKEGRELVNVVKRNRGY